ncbi:MAG: hypothetical protein RLZZ90_825 [Actinomycetota bacterium]
MRTQTRSLIAVATLGVLAASYQLGTAAETGLLVGAPVAPIDTTGSATPSATPSDTAGSATPKTVSTPVSSPAATKAPAAAPTKTAAPTKAPVASATTKTGAAIDYKYGTVQLEVTKASGIITDVNVLVGYGSGPEYNSVIAGLAAYAINANGSNFGNVSRATFSTNAFKQALDSALAKF